MIHGEKKILKFSGYIQRFFELRKFLKENPTAKVLEKGLKRTGCHHSFLYAVVEVQTEGPVKEPVTRYFYSEKERADFIKRLKKEHRKIIDRFDYDKHCYDGHIWAVKFEA